MQEFTYKTEGLLDVKVPPEEGFGIGTGLILDSLRAALAQAMAQAEGGFEAGEPILSAEK